MKFYLKSIALITLICTLTYSCQKDEVTTSNPEIAQEISEQVLQKIAKLGVNPSNVVRETITKNDGSKESGYLAHDIYFSESDLKTMEDLPSITDKAAQKLYRTTNMVNVPNRGFRTITIRGVNLDRSIENGLRDAVRNFNNLRLRFFLRLSFGRSSNGEEITVRQEQLSNNGGIGTFPSGGDPGDLIRIDPDNATQSRRILEALLTHELGHNFGLRHSDYQTQSSCRTFGGNEGAGTVGAVHIPGTSTSGDFQNSIMKVCIIFFGENDRGFLSEFTAEDRTGLRELY